MQPANHRTGRQKDMARVNGAGKTEKEDTERFGNPKKSNSDGLKEEEFEINRTCEQQIVTEKYVVV